MHLRTTLASLVLVAAAAPSWAGDWNAFRGPDGNGVSSETNVPVEWSADKNVKWKVALPQPGNGSPIVVKGRVLVNCAEDKDGQQRTLYCFDRKTGDKLWSQTVKFAQKMPTHQTNPYCGTTPASDGERVVTWHSSAGLYCYDLDGEKLWSRELGEFEHIWGYGSSPVIYKDRVLLNSGPGERVFMAAFDLKTGETLWEQEESQDSDNTSRNGAGKYKGAWATPIVVNVDGQDQAICTMPTRVVAYDPMSGDVIWSCDGIRGPKGDLAYSSPLVGGEFCVATGGFGGPSVALKLGGKGDVTETHRLWREEKNPQSIGSGVLIDGYVYKPNAGPGTIQCLKAETGDVVWTDRAAGSNHWGSMVLADGRLYVTNQDGATVVFKPNPEKYEEVAINELGEPCNTTPAISDGNVFIRTHRNLVCIGE
ncbi:MAG: PQQ-binding-like beta-propeller repeat protein [Pirellulaceae bacterium]